MCVLHCPDEGASAVTAAEETIARVFSDLKLEFGTKEASFSVHFESIEAVEKICIHSEATRRLLSLLSILPHGALKMSHDLEGLVSRACGGSLLPEGVNLSAY